MGKYEQRGPGNSLFSSKWFVVTACGAIAMVLGAMSVGARSGPHRDPVAEYPAPIAANQTVFLSEDSDSPTLLPSSQRTEQTHKGYSQSSPLSKGSVSKPDAIQISPVKGLGISLSLSPMNGSIAVSPNQIFTPSQETPATSDDSSSSDATTSNPPLQGDTNTTTPSEPVEIPESPSSTEMAAE